MHKKTSTLMAYAILITLTHSCLQASCRSKDNPIDIRLHNALQTADSTTINTIFSSNEYFPSKVRTNSWHTFFTPHQNKTPEWLYEYANKLVQNGICPQLGLEQLALGSHKIFKTNGQLASKIAQMFIKNDANIFAVIEFKNKKRTLFNTFLEEQCRMQRDKDNPIIAAIKTVLEQHQKNEHKLQETENKRNKNESTCSIQ